MASRMPENWTPPYDAWWPQFTDTPADSVIMAYHGVQSDGAPPQAFLNWVEAGLRAPHAPDHVERGRFSDQGRKVNTIFSAYWRTPDDYHAWISRPSYREWWDSEQRLHDGVGYWREIMIVPNTYFETLFSTTEMAGAGVIADRIGEAVCEHAYWGAARDRIKALSESDLASGLKMTAPGEGNSATLGRRVRLRLPAHLCLIHTAQDWSACSPAQETFYLDEVRPSLERGVADLISSPEETGCLAGRFVQELDDDWEPLKKTYVMCYFRSFSHLETWAEKHPRHLEIFGAFMRMAETFQFAPELRLWHEVSVLPPGDHVIEYVNCHPRTGLLPYVGLLEDIS